MSSYRTTYYNLMPTIRSEYHHVASHIEVEAWLYRKLRVNTQVWQELYSNKVWDVWVLYTPEGAYI